MCWMIFLPFYHNDPKFLDRPVWANSGTVCIFCTNYSVVKWYCSNFRIIIAFLGGFQIFTVLYLLSNITTMPGIFFTSTAQKKHWKNTISLKEDLYMWAVSWENMSWEDGVGRSDVVWLKLAGSGQFTDETPKRQSLTRPAMLQRLARVLKFWT